MLKVQASVSKAWLNKHGNFVFDRQYYLDPSHRRDVDRQCHRFIKSRFPDLPIYNMEDNLVQAEYVVPEMMLVGAIQPNMIIAAALGAELVFDPERDSDIKGLPLRDLKSSLELPDPARVLELEFIKELEKQYNSAQKDFPNARIIPSFFWDTSGRATIHGIITTSMKFMGEDIFVKMMLEKELVHKIHQWITEVYIIVLKHFARLGAIPISSVHVGECSGTMINEMDYREFVVPYINQLGQEFSSVRLHSCGVSDAIMPAICEIHNLAVIDTGSNTSIAKIRKKMGSDFEIHTVPPVDTMTGENTAGMDEWLKRTLLENDGGKLQIGYHLEPGYNESNCIYIHDFLHEKKLVQKSRLY